MQRRLLASTLLFTAAMVSAGCNNREDNLEIEIASQNPNRIAQEFDTAKELAAKHPDNRLLQTCIGELTRSMKSVERSSRSDADSILHAVRSFNVAQKNFHRILALNDCSAELRKKLMTDTIEMKHGPRALFHINQALLDLDLFDECAPSEECLDLVRQHARFAELLKMTPGAALNVNDDSELLLRDQMFLEGDFESHPGNGELIKAHLRQAARYLAALRPAVKNRTDRGLRTLIKEELTCVFNLRRGPDPLHRDGRVVIVTRIVSIKQAVSRRAPGDANLANLVSEVDAHLLRLSQEGPYEMHDFGQLIYAVQCLENAYYRTIPTSK